MTIDKLNVAISAVRAGDKASGQQLLSEIVKAESSNETAWLWLSACVDNIEQKKYCLTKALSINPDNQNARKALTQLEQPPQPSMEDIVPRSIAKPTESDESKVPPKPATPFPTHVIAPRAKPPPSKKRKQVSTVWIVRCVLILGVVVVGAIGVSIFLKITLAPAVSVSQPAASCLSLINDYEDKIIPLMEEFTNAQTAGLSASGITLESVIQDMQRIKRDIANVSPPSCVQGTSDLIVNGMNSIINVFIGFMGDEYTPVQRRLSQGWLDLNNGTDQLVALA